jgi:hypothetical protein
MKPNGSSKAKRENVSVVDGILVNLCIRTCPLVGKRSKSLHIEELTTETCKEFVRLSS